MTQSNPQAPTPAPQAPTGSYEPPAILWEQAFVALAASSIFDPCQNPSDPSCTSFGPRSPSIYD